MQTGRYLLMFGGLMFVLALKAGPLPGAEFTLKMATVSPENTSWADCAYRIKEQVEEKSGGRVKFILYLGASMKSEIDIVERMKRGEIQVAGITRGGLGHLIPETRILSLPFLFYNYDEVDYALKKVTPHFEKIFAQRGYVHLGWAEVGLARLLSRVPIGEVSNFKNIRMWEWIGDPISRETNRLLGFQNVPLTIPGTHTGFENGTLDGTISTAYATVAFQSHPYIRYISLVPFSYMAAALVMRKDAFEELPPDLQEVVGEAFRLNVPELFRVIREDDKKAWKGLIDRGVEVVRYSQAEVEQFWEMTKPVYKMFIDRLYPSWLLYWLMNTLEEYRFSRADRD